MARNALQHALRLPELQDQLRGAGAADVQLQQPLRRLSDVRRAWPARANSIPTWCCPIAACRSPNGRLRPGRPTRAAAEQRHRRLLEPFAPADSVRWKLPLDRVEAGGDGAIAARQRLRLAGPVDHSGKRICDGHACRPLASGWKDFERAWCVPTAAVRGCGRKPAMSASTGRAIHEIAAMSAQRAAEFFAAIEVHPDDLPIYQPLANEIRNRLTFLGKVGLDYLTLDRPGRHAQRRRTAARAARHGHRLGAGRRLLHSGRALDRPASARQPAADRCLRNLQEQGNTVLVVEHDEAMMLQADHLIDIGPGAGLHGGRIVAQGTPQQVCDSIRDSLTGQYLSGRLQIPVPAERRRIAKTRTITLEGATTNNLKNVNVQFPLGRAGVRDRRERIGQKLAAERNAGPGDSSPADRRRPQARAACQPARRESHRQAGRNRSIADRPHAAQQSGHVHRRVRRSAASVRRNSRGQAARLSLRPVQLQHERGPLRRVPGPRAAADRNEFSAPICTSSARSAKGSDSTGRRWKFAIAIARSPTCSTCGSTRRSSSSRISRVIHRLLASLHEVGLGYLTLGQSSTTLSGGEAQRIKLATELGRVDTGQTLYLWTSRRPGCTSTTSSNCLDVLQRLVDRGNTVIVIEHNLDVIKTADWIIDLGPEGGDAGGQSRGDRHAGANRRAGGQSHRPPFAATVGNGRSVAPQFARSGICENSDRATAPRIFTNPAAVKWPFRPINSSESVWHPAPATAGIDRDSPARTRCPGAMLGHRRKSSKSRKRCSSSIAE